MAHDFSNLLGVILNYSAFVAEEVAPEAGQPRWQAVLDDIRHIQQAAGRAADLTRQLRTPLNTILGFGELLSLEGLGAEQREWMTMTMRASRHLVQLMDGARDVVQIEDRALTLSMQAVPVHALVADVLELIAPLALSEGIHLGPAPRAAATQHVRADEQRLRQIMLNLLSNPQLVPGPAGHGHGHLAAGMVVLDRPRRTGRPRRPRLPAASAVRTITSNLPAVTPGGNPRP